MNIIVFDTEGPRRTEIAAALRTLGHMVFEHGGVTWIGGMAPEVVDACFFHVSDSGNWSKVEDIPGIRKRVLWYSGAGLNFVPKIPAVGSPIPRPIRVGSQMDPSLFAEILTSAGPSIESEKSSLAGIAVAIPEPSPPLPSVQRGGPVKGHAEGIPRLLQDETPSVLIAISILCEGFMLTTEADAEKTRKLPKGTVSKVRTKEWWRRPFAPVLSSLEDLTRKEWGMSEPDRFVLDFVAWISGPADNPPEGLDTLVPKIRECLKKHLV